ncbi:universal stress protein [Comamonas sp.]|uniref:universal stress protein n=1 Tax=Comamonas sp. TaxID=34028 RepID=UPI00289DD517|nr:universal stress protein [Comamonas sp.]
MRILLAVDGSPYTQKMLDYLAAHAEWLTSNHHYTALTVQPLLPPRAAKALGKALVDDYHSEEAQKVLVPVQEFLAAHQVKAVAESAVGPISQTIAETADNGGYDLLIMGTRGHGALAKLVLGSVATQVLAESKVPVLLVR